MNYDNITRREQFLAAFARIENRVEGTPTRQVGKVTLSDCPIGLFLSEDGELCLKTEYGNNEGRIDAYVVSTGEFFWGSSPQTISNQRSQIVVPINANSVGGDMHESHVASFQARVDPWLLTCFGEDLARRKNERNHRFLEEALELVQSMGSTKSEALQLVDYVFDRPVGEPAQEVGGVMMTLAALCLANNMDMHEAGEAELARVWTMVEKIRAKQAAKPSYSPLPGKAS